MDLRDRLPYGKERGETYEEYYGRVFSLVPEVNLELRAELATALEFLRDPQVTALVEDNGVPINIATQAYNDFFSQITADVQSMSVRPTVSVAMPEFQTVNRSPRVRKKSIPKREDVSSMIADVLKSESFPKPNFTDWQGSRRVKAVDEWYMDVDYRDQWIFERREREGFNRRNIGNFHLDDVMGRIEKLKRPHHLNTDNSTFYDWKLGGSNFTLRLEKYTQNGVTFLISRYIFNPDNREVRYDIRLWRPENESFERLLSLFVEEDGNEGHIEYNFNSLIKRYEQNQSRNNPFSALSYVETMDSDDDYGDSDDYDGEDDDY